MSEREIEYKTPAVDWQTLAYWGGCGRGEIVLQRCSECASVQHRPRGVCADCLSSGLEHFVAQGQADPMLDPRRQQLQYATCSGADIEQMADRYPEALFELRRISRKYVILHEPFFDVNDGFGNTYLWSQNYFRIRVQELERHGLRVRQLTRCLPVKLAFAYAIVIAEIV